MLPIDIYDSATPEPGYEDMSIAEVFAAIDEQWAEAAYYAEQEEMQRQHEEMLYANERYDWDYLGPSYEVRW